MGPSPATSAPRCTCRSRHRWPATDLRRSPSSSTRARQEPSSTSPRTWPGSPAPTDRLHARQAPHRPRRTRHTTHRNRLLRNIFRPPASGVFSGMTIRIAHGPNRPTTKPDLLPRTRRAPSALQNKRGSTPSNALATASASHTPPWTASRSATERARRASRPSPRIVGRPPPRRARAMRRMLSNCVPATTCSHSAPGPLTLTHTGFSSGCRRVAAGLCGRGCSVPADDGGE